MTSPVRSLPLSRLCAPVGSAATGHGFEKLLVGRVLAEQLEEGPHRFAGAVVRENATQRHQALVVLGAIELGLLARAAGRDVDGRKDPQFRQGTVEDKLKTGKALSEKDAADLRSVVTGMEFLQRQYSKPIQEFRELERFLADQLAAPAMVAAEPFRKPRRDSNCRSLIA